MLLENLTKEQEALIPVFRDKWVDKGLTPVAIDPDKAREQVGWLYSLDGMDPPEVIVAEGPVSGAIEVLKRKGEEVSQEKIREQIKKMGVIGLGYDSSWTSFYDYFRELGIVDLPEFDRWLEFMETGIWDGYYYQNLAVVFCAPHTVLEPPREDSAQIRRLHCLTGPALHWPDGFKMYRVRGVEVEPEVVENPESITLDRILSEQNVEVRKALIEIIGVDRFLELGEADVIDEDMDKSGMPRRLLSLRVGAEDRWCVLEVECPSKRDKHYLWVPPEMERCSQACAWTFRFEAPSEYSPMVET